jgi:hypothetical protein
MKPQHPPGATNADGHPLLQNYRPPRKNSTLSQPNMYTNTTSTVPLPQAIPANTVSWSFLYLGLVAFAINSMTQPGDMVCGFNADVGFLLKSSPIICNLDAMLVLYDLFSEYWATRLWKTAHTEMIRRRFNSERYRGFKDAKRADMHVNRTNE